MLDDQIDSVTKIEFETRLFNELELLDDPLDLFIEYISWLHSSGNDNIDELDKLLYRCISYISKIDTYYNDPRLLKIWLWHIDNIISKNEKFNHNTLQLVIKEFQKMYNIGIGIKLSLWYETLTKILFDFKLIEHCIQILRIGINNNARPLKRLKISLNQYESNISNEINIPIINDLSQFLQNIIIQDKPSQVKSNPVYKIINPGNGRKLEKIDCNFNLIYEEDTNNYKDNYNFEQILAISRNVYIKKEKKNIPMDKKSVIYQDSSITQTNTKKHLIYMDSQDSNNSQQPLKKLNYSNEKHSDRIPLTSNIKDTKENEYTNVTTTSILPLNDDNTHTQTLNMVPHSPTVTMFSKDAINDVYSMFNQQGDSPESSSQQPDDNTTNIRSNNNTGTINLTNRYAVFEGDGFTQDFTRPNIDDLTEVKTQLKESQTQQNDIPRNNTITNEFHSDTQDFMTPIQEKTEITDIRSTQSSPFLTQPPQFPLLPTAPTSTSEKPLMIDHPLDINLRKNLLVTITPPLDEYKNFYRYNQPLRMSSLLKRIHKVSKSENKNPIVDFKKTGDLYCIRSELGQGGYAIVYLAESDTGNLKALKIERPASVWEYYILKQIESRLPNAPILQSIIQVDSLHYFLDESYLVLNYANQGTVLDLINSQQNNGSLDELLCMFLTVELMKVIESIHDIGIIHGDLKPDNCMIRFETISMDLGHYNRDSRQGWNHKGIYLIDFGRSFDMTLFPNGTKFKSDWKTDQQDCSEMRLGKEWTFEADYYGLASILHSLLFGQFIDTIRLPNNRYKLRKPFKRYWHTDQWNEIFNILLNSGDIDQWGPLPITPRIKTLRHSLEDILEQDNNSDKLRRIILDLEIDLKSKDKTNDKKII
ncbi:hypothetical protein C6P45_003184 [Maudiozyma exigua]|uniref:Protein kinase domain-containing protein n=1 Tax=Maudiozyma exigua TaxID=34358 RepID=A0A9P6WEU9_MAUEX|nr:hypothetical protein C6P45_003184 [Kazachstania exigua]